MLKFKANSIKWWEQFPHNLRIITKGRLWASIGAGGVLYLSPLVFNKIGLSGTEIGYGISIAAAAGTIARFLTGLALDKNSNCSKSITIAALSAITADIILLLANDFHSYIFGELFLGIAAGVYWPSAELAVPKSCQNISSSKGFALARTADALGISIGVLIGALLAWNNAIRLIYIIDFLSLLKLINIINNKKLKKELLNSDKERNKEAIISQEKDWLKKILPVIFISIFATSILTLLQSALPLDLVKGSIYRPGLNEAFSSAIIALQLILILLFQWPIGVYLSNKKIKFGLRVSLVFLGAGCFTLSLSGLIKFGIIFIILALFFLSIGIASFLPTGTEAIIKLSGKRKGTAMAIYSQSFSISSLIAPIMAGKLIDKYHNSILLWFAMGVFCICILPITNYIRKENHYK